MSFSWLSILGMYEHDPTVMDGLQVPEGMDRETVVNNILLNCAELEVIYSHIESMRLAIKVWSDSNQIGWKKMYDTMTVEYNPIWNVDADIEDIETISGSNTQTRTGSENRDIVRNLTGSDNETVNLQDNRTIDTHDNRTIDTEDKETINTADNRTINTADNETVDLTDTKAVQGFNSSSWANAEKIDKTGTDNIAHTGTDNVAHTGTDTTEHTGTDNVAHTGTDNVSHTGTDNIAHTQNERTDDDLTSSESISGENDTTRSYKQRRTGNIGVTTTQQMLEQEREIAKFNMVEYITESFKKRFCLMIY